MSAEDTQAPSSVDPNLAHCAPDTIDHWWELRCQRKGGDGVTGTLIVVLKLCLTKISSNLSPGSIIRLLWSRHPQGISQENIFLKKLRSRYKWQLSTSNKLSVRELDRVEFLFIFIFVSVRKCGLCLECQLTGFTNVSRWQSVQHPPMRDQNSHF